MTQVVVWGLPGSGKTRNSAALARHYGCRHVVDADHSLTEAERRRLAADGGVLVLALRPEPGAIPLADALAAAGIGASGQPA